MLKRSSVSWVIRISTLKPHHPYQNVYNESKAILSVKKDMEKVKSSHTAWRTLGIFRHCLLYPITQQFYSKVYTRTWNVYICLPNDIYEKIHNITVLYRQKCPVTVEKINKLYYFHAMTFSGVPRMNKLLWHVTTWMNLINIMLNEISQV